MFILISSSIEETERLCTLVTSLTMIMNQSSKKKKPQKKTHSLKMQHLTIKWMTQSSVSHSLYSQLFVSISRWTAEWFNIVFDPCCVGNKVFLVDKNTSRVRCLVENFIRILRRFFLLCVRKEEKPCVHIQVGKVKALDDNVMMFLNS